jgi:hypothetical protein
MPLPVPQTRAPQGWTPPETRTPNARALLQFQLGFELFA